MPSDCLNVPHPENDVLRTLVDRLPAMVAYWDATQRCRFANRAYERWFGVSPESLLGKHISELLGPLYPLNLPHIEAVLRGEPREFEREIPDPKGGRSRHSLANYIPYVVDDVVRGFFVLVTDISEVKRTQLKLRQSEERFRLTIDEAPIGMAIVTLDGRLTRVNRVLCELLGYTSGELEALTFQAITHPEDLDADLVLAGQLAHGEIPRYQLEKRYLRKDGSVMQALLSGSVLRAPNGLPIHFVAQIQDITAAKRLEREQRFLVEVGPVLASSLDYEETLARIAELSVRDLADTCLVEIVDDDEAVRRLKVVSRDPSKASVTEALMRVRLDRDRPSLVREVLGTRPRFCGRLRPSTRSGRWRKMKSICAFCARWRSNPCWESPWSRRASYSARSPGCPRHPAARTALPMCPWRRSSRAGPPSPSKTRGCIARRSAPPRRAMMSSASSLTICAIR